MCNWQKPFMAAIPRDLPKTRCVTSTGRRGAVAAMQQAGLLDAPPEDAFDRLTRLAARSLGVPISLVSLVDANRQFFKSSMGLPEPVAAARQTPLSHSFCKHVVLSGEPLIVPDARLHPVLKDNPAIGMGVVAYAGYPLATQDGLVLGSFCAIDTSPREWTAEQLGILQDLTAAAMTEIELRRSNYELRRKPGEGPVHRDAESRSAHAFVTGAFDGGGIGTEPEAARCFSGRREADPAEHRVGSADDRLASGCDAHRDGEAEAEPGEPGCAPGVAVIGGDVRRTRWRNR